MREATVCHLLRGEAERTEVLLGCRRSLFADGLWNGPGGKFEPIDNGCMYKCSYREVHQEINVRIDITSAVHFATADFYHPRGDGHSLEWRVHFLTIRKWSGKLKPVDGFSELGWFPYYNLPYLKMMADQKAWLPLALHIPHNKILSVKIYFADTDVKIVSRGEFVVVDRPIRH